MKYLRPTLLATLSVATLGFVPVASAQQARDPAAAEALFLAGRDAVGRGDYVTACPKFAESNRLDPAAGTLINLADCEEHAGTLAAAWDHWKGAVELLSADDARRPIAQQRAVALEKRVPRLTIKLTPDAPTGTKILRDDVEIGIASLSIPLPENPGSHAVTVSAPGRQARVYAITLNEGQSSELVVAPGDAERVAPPAPTGSPAVPSPLADKPIAPRETRTLGFVVGAVGLASVGAGAAFGIEALAKKSDLKNHCNPSTVCDLQGANDASSGRTFATVSTVTFIAGAALLGIGAYFVFSSPHRSGSLLALTPDVGPKGGGFRLVRTF